MNPAILFEEDLLFEFPFAENEQKNPTKRKFHIYNVNDEQTQKSSVTRTSVSETNAASPQQVVPGQPLEPTVFGGIPHAIDPTIGCPHSVDGYSCDNITARRECPDTRCCGYMKFSFKKSKEGHRSLLRLAEQQALQRGNFLMRCDRCLDDQEPVKCKDAKTPCPAHRRHQMGTTIVCEPCALLNDLCNSEVVARQLAHTCFGTHLQASPRLLKFSSFLLRMLSDAANAMNAVDQTHRVTCQRLLNDAQSKMSYTTWQKLMDEPYIVDFRTFIEQELNDDECKLAV